MSAAEVPIRQIDDIEIPVFGMWPAVGASRVVRSTGSRSARAVPVVSGWLEVGDDPATNALCIELDDSILLATTARVSHNGHGWSEWHLEGVACTVDRRDPLALTLRYHGVYQRGGDALAWWSGEGTIAAPDDRRGRRARRGRRRMAADGERFGVQLLLAAPGRSGVSLTNVVAYMQRRMNATTIANEARHAADPTFGMLQRIVRAARADIDAATPVLSARPWRAAACGADSPGFWADVVGGGADQLGGRGLLDGVDAPANGAADGERGVNISRGTPTDAITTPA